MQDRGIDYKGCKKTLGVIHMFIIWVVVTRYAKTVRFYTLIYTAYYASTVTP